ELHLERKEQRNVKLIETAEDVKLQKQETDAGRSNHYNDDIRGQYSVWRREYGNILPDTTLKLMKGQIIMAKVYASIARRKFNGYCCTKGCNSDDKLPEGYTLSYLSVAHRHAEEMGKALSAAKEVLMTVPLLQKNYGHGSICERSITAQKEKGIQSLQHCTACFHLTTDYFSQGHSNRSTINSNGAGEHVFHIVTDKLNFAAMKISCRSASTLSPGDAHLKHRNPRYLSCSIISGSICLNCSQNLDKILLLDDDVVVQRDLTPLWSMDMKGMVNGAVEICGGSFHRFDAYLNFSDPRIYLYMGIWDEYFRLEA
ncbi:putative galacturonosyltransferase 3, partial [Ananas comosus]